MIYLNKFLRTIAILAIATIAACGSGSDPTISCDPGSEGSGATVACSNTLRFIYEAVTTPQQGRSEIKITLQNQESGEPISGADLTVKPWMVMESAMEHGSVVGSVTDNGNGTYSAVVYYLMASMMNGVKLGQWELGVTANGETVAFNPNVGMAMGQTLRVVFKQDSDTIPSMGGPATRSYFIFSDSCEQNGEQHTFRLMLATRQSLANHPTIYTGQSLTNGDGQGWTINQVNIEASTDGSSWVSMTEEGGGYFMTNSLTGMTNGMASDIFVRLSINGTSYTTDGAPSNSGNQTQTLRVIPGGMGMGM